MNPAAQELPVPLDPEDQLVDAEETNVTLHGILGEKVNARARVP